MTDRVLHAPSSALALIFACAAWLPISEAWGAPMALASFRSSKAEFANPERGFYRPGGNLEALSAARAAAAYDAGYRLLYTPIDLAGYRDRDLSPELLVQLDAGFAAARAAGVKLIVRAAYNYPKGETDYRDAQDAPLALVLRHIDQLRPVLQRNADVVAFVQAGFVGAWGEWHGSSNGLADEPARTRIKDALLAAVPADRFVQFRYPPYIEEWAPQLPALPSALDGRFRLGFHNDCFLASATDVGTFSEDAVARAARQRYIARLGALGPFGGETCNPADDPRARPRTDCAAILGEGRRYRLTYLNDSYYRPLFHDRWAPGGCLEEIRRRMGYRFVLSGLSHPASATRGTVMELRIGYRNEGWARLYNRRPLAVVLDDGGSMQWLEASGADPRRWLPGGTAIETLRVELPSQIARGRYRISLALPDADPRLARDPRYAVRFANADDPARDQRWNEETGAFQTGTALTIE